MRTPIASPASGSFQRHTSAGRPSLHVPWSAVDPDADATPWSGIRWHSLTPLERDRPCPATRFRLLASPAGVHARIVCTATRLTASMRNDGDPLYLQDVVELFFWPDPTDERRALYLEHEVSPSGRCLMLIIASDGSPRARWTPWGLDGEDKPRQHVTIRRQRGHIRGWEVAVCLPWQLFVGLGGTPPARGACWRGNITRIDHRHGVARHAAWSLPTAVNFHQLPAMGDMHFEAAPRIAPVTSPTRRTMPRPTSRARS